MNQNTPNNLALPVAKPPWTQIGRRIESQIRKALYELKLIPKDGKLAIALSGGKDSLTLLYMLAAISGRGFDSFKLCAIHVHGAFSCGSSLAPQFLKNICNELGVDFIQCEQPPPKESPSCYPCSRERRKLLFYTAKENNYNTIAFGHHQDDFNETLMMNLLHKGEFASNLPKVKMENYAIEIVRPLVYVAEQDIISFAKQSHFHRIVCRCPFGENSMRKKTNHLISYIEKTFPNVRTNLAQAGKNYGSQKAAKP